jgi:molybdopterin/thiamine biosynthesis adenylyltransferase
MSDKISHLEILPLDKKKDTPETAELRFEGSVPLTSFRSKTIGIAGLGATGKQVAEILAVMGHKAMWGADPDKIELKNVGTQGWSERNEGYYKAEVLIQSLESRRSSFEGRVNRFESCFQSNDRNIRTVPAKTDVFFCCVDTMRARSEIWSTLRRKRLLQGPKLWVESRIASRVIRIMTIDLSDATAKRYYESTLYSDSSAFQGSCTDRMTYYGAGIAAGLMVSQLVNWLNYNIVSSPDFMLETAGMGMTRIK